MLKCFTLCHPEKNLSTSIEILLSRLLRHKGYESLLQTCKKYVNNIKSFYGDKKTARCNRGAMVVLVRVSLYFMKARTDE
jgi:hypothetical protein